MVFEKYTSNTHVCVHVFISHTYSSGAFNENILPLPPPQKKAKNQQQQLCLFFHMTAEQLELLLGALLLFLGK